MSKAAAWANGYAAGLLLGAGGAICIGTIYAQPFGPWPVLFGLAAMAGGLGVMWRFRE